MRALLPRRERTVAVDTETTGLYPDEGARIASVAVAWEGGSRAFNFGHPGKKEPAGTYTRLMEELAGRELIFHNANFDLIMLAAGPPVPLCPFPLLTDALEWDTMLAHRILFPTSSASLDAASRQLGLTGKAGLEELQGWLKENKVKKYEYSQAPWELAKPYVTTDAEQTFELYRAQLACAPDPERDELGEIEREIDLCKILTKLEHRGVGYDTKKSLKIAEEVSRRADALEATMPFSCSINIAKAFFFDKCGLVPDRVSEKTGAPSLDKEQIRDWALENVEWAQEYKEVVWARRAVARWYQGYAEKCGADGRLRVRYRQGTVTSGRLSAERINLQAMPLGDKIEQDVPGPRELLKAPRGKQLWSLDMSQAELRIGAKYARCRRMIDMLEEGTDFHAVTTENVLDVQPDDPDWKGKRVIGKKLNFSSMYGIGGETFQRLLAREAGIHLSLQECTEMVWGWRAFWPEFPRAARAAEKVFESRGWVRILMDSHHETRSYMQETDWPHTGWNRMVQGSLAAWMRLWLVEIEEHYPGALVLTVHDSAVLELPTSEAKRTVASVCASGSERASDIFGLKMPIDAERVG